VQKDETEIMSDAASKILRTFACDCADRAINRAREAGHEIDPRILEAVRVARLYADGKATNEELGKADINASNSTWVSGHPMVMQAAWAAVWTVRKKTDEAATESAQCTLRRYLVFETDCNNPGGGWEDFIGAFDSEEDADSFAKKNVSEYAICHVVDTWHQDINRPYSELKYSMRKEDGFLVPIVDDVVEFVFWDDSEENE
jgi:hypothetical protein